MNEFFESTENKRKWSVVNPGYILSLACSYFVFGYENKMIDQLCLDGYLESITVDYQLYEGLNNNEKTKFLIRRLRNSIAHCRYKAEVCSDDGKIRMEGDVYFIFSDQAKKGDDKITIGMSLPIFANIVEAAGKTCMKALRSA